ncbi:pyridoxal phosphate-dependent aminotransferase [Jatrophihabitans sp. DSM 45814]
MEIFSAAEVRRAQGRAVYNLAAGQPSTAAPRAVRSAATAALTADKIGYTATLGIPSLRDAIAAHTKSWYDIDVEARNVVVTTGSSGGFLLSFLASFDAGDVVAMARPGYPAYRNILKSLGVVVEEFDCGPDLGFMPSLDIFEAMNPRPDGIILASPANPTGAMVSGAALEQIVAWCSAAGVRLISDELYHGISFTVPASSAWQYGRDSIVVNSFSKYFSMTGWRLGWLLVPDILLDAVDRLASNYAICPPALSQLAAVAAFEAYAELDENVERYKLNRALLLDALPSIGLPRFAPADGAFYMYVDVSDFTDDSLLWVRKVLDDTGVALAPGVDFDTRAGQRFARLSFAGEIGELAQGLDVLGKYLRR